MIPTPKVSELATPAASTEGGIRLLHLEDNPQDQALVQLILRRAGLQCRIIHADTLEDFSRSLQQEPFDLIIADYYLPGFTALDAWQVLQQQAAAPPIVLLSGAIGEAAAVDAMRLGFADYLLKDDMARLPHVLQRALEVAQARQAREQAVAELAESEQRLAALAEHLQTTIEEERTAIAREIHDDISGALAAARFDLAWLQRHASSPAHTEHAANATEMLQHAIDASQRLMQHLRPPVLDQGLVAAVRWLAESFERRTRIPVRLSSSSESLNVPTALQLVAYRTAQEALTNIHKHAQAQRVHIDLSDHEQVLTLEVSDDGQGIAPQMLQKPRSFGIKGLQERAHRAGGWMDISSRPGHGTSVILSLPLTSRAMPDDGETHD